MKHYIIRGGVEGKKRLEVLGRTMWPVTSRALARAGLCRGMTSLDLGCGGGDVTLELAAVVGPDGQAVGVDYDEVKLALAREAGTKRGLRNLEFRQIDVEKWEEDSCYDFIYCRFLLTHLKDPRALLCKMLCAVRPGGAVLVEDINFAGYVHYPRCAALEKYVRLYQTAAARRGCDADIGPKLYLMLLDTGWERLGLDVVQPTFFSGEGKEIAILTLINISEAVLAEKLATRAELETAIEELASYTADERTVISMPRVFQVWGRRPLAPAA
jgi:trans-aconitate methyltransferase